MPKPIPASVETVMVRVRSHRAANRLKTLLGQDLAWHFNLYDGNNFVAVPAGRLDEARRIPGVTRARPSHPLMKCWTW